jgi:hypothetical protein
MALSISAMPACHEPWQIMSESMMPVDTMPGKPWTVAAQKVGTRKKATNKKLSILVFVLETPGPGCGFKLGVKTDVSVIVVLSRRRRWRRWWWVC